MAGTITNGQIYKKTLGFSLWRLMWDFLAFIVLAGMTIGGFLIADSVADSGWVGLAIGLIIGGFIAYLILHYIAFSYKAGQIAMMTKGVTEGKLPDNVVEEGKKIVKARFKTVAAYYVVTGAIKGIFRQLGQGITAAGRAVGGDGGNAVGGTIAGIIDTIVAYLCDCCLGWVFYRNKEKATRATLEGAVLFFKHGKTLIKNLGRVFGIGLLSLVLIGGVFGVVAYLIMSCFPDAFNSLAQTIEQTGSGEEIPGFLTDATNLMITFAVIVGIVFWDILHWTFVRPFVLVGVLRNFINSGINDVPNEKSFDELDEKSAKFAKLHKKLEEE